MSPPDPELSRTVQDGVDAAFRAGADVAATVATDIAKDGANAPIRLQDEAFGTLLRRQGLDPDQESEGARYDIQGSLGKGSGGAVWAAHDHRLQRPIALKVLNRGGDRRHFISEARITAELQHPHVLPVYDLTLTAAGDPCFAMKRIDGMTLGKALATTPRPAAIATMNGMISVFIAIAQALAYAHDRGFIHQDIKPDNILLGGFGEVLLCDWGCAVRQEARGKRLYGTPLYMAPEQARREFADGRSDIYCFGATLFHALVGRPPTNPDLDRELFWKRKCAGEIDAPTPAERALAPPAVLAIALKALSPSPAERYARAEDLLADLRAYQAGLAVSAWREPLWRVIGRWCRQHRSECLTVVVAGIVVALALGMWWREKLRENAAWHVVDSDDFSDPAASTRRWRAVATGNGWPTQPVQEVPFAGDRGVHLAGGRMICGNGSLLVDVALRERLYGNLAAEWDYAPVRDNRNLNCFIGDDRYSAYTFHVGGWGDPTYVAMTRGNGNDLEGGALLACTHLDQPIVKGRTYHFRLEREDDRMTLAIDGRTIISCADPLDPRAVAPQSIGFDAFYGEVNAVGDVHIWTKPLSERISPLMVAGALVESGNKDAALRQYHELSHVYGDDDIGVEAGMRAALMELRTANAPPSEQALDALVAAHPAHALAPFALAEAHAAALMRGDHAAAERELTSLLAYPGHQAQVQALFDIGIDHLHDVQDHRSDPAQRVSYPSDVISTIAGVTAELETWAARYGVPVTANRFLEAAGAAGVLARCGRADFVLAHWPPRDRERGPALIETGALEEAVNHWSYLVDFKIALRADQALDQRERLLTLGDEGRIAALDHARDLAGMVRDFPYVDVTAQRLISAGKAAEIADNKAYSDVARMWAMLALGRPEEANALAWKGDEHGMSRCQLALGREDLVLTYCAQDLTATWWVALRRVQRGDAAGAAALIAKLRDTPPDYASFDEVAAYYFTPALFACAAGHAEDARAGLSGAMAATRFSNGLRIWHIVAYASGAEDETAFNAQPWKEGLTWRLMIAKALRAECQGDAASARTLWADWLAYDHSMDAESLLRALAHWRVATP
jgi:serine/threonine protein kinase